MELLKFIFLIIAMSGMMNSATGARLKRGTRFSCDLFKKPIHNPETGLIDLQTTGELLIACLPESTITVEKVMIIGNCVGKANKEAYETRFRALMICLSTDLKM